MGQYEHHVFVCTHGKTCAADMSSEVFKTLKEGAKNAGLRYIAPPGDNKIKTD